MNLLLICAGDRSNYSIALNCLSHIYKQKKDKITVFLLDDDQEIVKFTNKRKIKLIRKNFDEFAKKIKKDQFDWL